MIWSIGAWRSLVSRLVRVQEAPGSNPGAPTKIAGIYFCRFQFFHCQIKDKKSADGNPSADFVLLCVCRELGDDLNMDLS